MAVSYKYWDDCIDPEDMEEMWSRPEVSTEWLDAGETKGQKVHLSRDPDGKNYLTQTEMRAVAEIIVSRHFDSQIDPDALCALAELQSDRQILAMRYDKKTKQTTLGIMQISPKTAEWLVSELGYKSYEVEGNPDLLYKPFVNIYFGAAYLKYLSNFEQKERNEEFVVRAYKGGTKKAAHKSTLPYWTRYLLVKESLPTRKFVGGTDSHEPDDDDSVPTEPVSNPDMVKFSGNGAAGKFTYWESRACPEDIEEMWNHPDVVKEWTKSGEKRGQVRFANDEQENPYLSRVELKAIAEIILSKHFSTRGVKPTVLCALAEIVSMRFVNGVAPRTGIMGVDYSTAFWIYMELGYRAYKVDSADDLKKPFVSMYFGAAYMAWLSEYEGSERTPQFVVQAYLAGPENVDTQENAPLWMKFRRSLSTYEGTRRDRGGSCSIL